MLISVDFEQSFLKNLAKASYRSVMKLTKNYILTRDDTSETGLIVHKRHNFEYVGVIGAPFEGEWGWDYEIEGNDSSIIWFSN